MRITKSVIGRFKVSRGFTMIEVMLTVVFLGLLATGVTALYSSGARTQEYQAERTLLDSKIRSRMEKLISTDFQSLSNGTENVTVNGKTYTINWSLGPVDLNNDGVNEISAKTVTVSVSEIPDISVVTIVIDHENMIGKIS